ncbi:MAG TPA: trypsin-like peptidase domain-containing protein, partial [Solirubrobacteraceae bacterium]
MRRPAVTALVMAAAVLSPYSPDALAADRGDVVARALRSVVVVETGDGLGSGFAFGRGEEILTNAHVVGEADRVDVVDENDRRHSADVVALDVDSDVARLRLDAPLPALRAAPGPARPGEDVIAIGAPNG